MATLLILGAKPDPALPPGSAYDEIACANASGFSAARYGLPVPSYTLVTANLTSGGESGRQSLQALGGLSTGTVYFVPGLPLLRGVLLGRFLKAMQGRRASPAEMQHILRMVSFRYERFVVHEYSEYLAMVARLCDSDPMIAQLMRQKRPSTGVLALAVGSASRRYDRYILSGFSFELSHAYANNPQIEERGTLVSKHIETDVAVLRYLRQKNDNLFTTERVVSETVGLPLIEAARLTPR